VASHVTGWDILVHLMHIWLKKYLLNVGVRNPSKLANCSLLLLLWWGVLFMEMWKHILYKQAHNSRHYRSQTDTIMERDIWITASVIETRLYR
jgi:hypothetical protein